VLSVKAAASLAGVSAGLVYLWCAERRLPHVRCGGRGRRGRILINESDLAAFLESCRVAADSTPPVKTPGPVAGAFQNLDAGRLLAAWRERGGVGEGLAFFIAAAMWPAWSPRLAR
jgi:excisionase family DNA binding protein